MRSKTCIVLFLLASVLSSVNSASAQGGDEENPLKPTELVTDGRVAYMPVFYVVLNEAAQDRFGIYVDTVNEKFIQSYENGEFQVVMLFVFGQCLGIEYCDDTSAGFSLVDGDGYFFTANDQLSCTLCEKEWELGVEGEGYLLVFAARSVENMEFYYVPSYSYETFWFDVFDWEEAKQYMAQKNLEVDPVLYELIDGEIGAEDTSVDNGLLPSVHEGTLGDPIPVGERLINGENSFTIHAVDVYPDLYGEDYPTYCMLVEYHTDLNGGKTDTSEVFIFDPITIDGKVNYLWGAWDANYIEEDAGIRYGYEALIEMEAENRVDWFGVNCFQVFEKVEIGAISFPTLRLGDETAHNVVFSIIDAPTIEEYDMR